MKIAVFVKLFLIIGLCSQYSFTIKPDRIYHNRPSDFGMKYKEYKVKTHDNIDLNVWEIQAVSPLKKQVCIILCAGDAGNMGYYMQQTKGLLQGGFDVILFDYRGFGESSNFKIDSTLLFHSEFLTDYEAVFKDVKARKKGKIGVLGFSMGGYFPMAAREKPDFIVLDSAMLNLNGVLQRLNKPNLKLPQNYSKILPHVVPTIAFWGQDDKITRATDNILWNKQQINVNYKGGHMQLFQVLEPFHIIGTLERFTL